MVQPFEVKTLPEIEFWNGDRFYTAMQDAYTACNGAPYFGDRGMGQYDLIRYMRAYPDQADILLGRV